MIISFPVVAGWPLFTRPLCLTWRKLWRRGTLMIKGQHILHLFLLDKKVKASHIENCKVLINDWPDEFWKLSRTFRQASWGLVEETVPLLSQDGGYGSHAAASHVFTADPGGVRHPHQHAINRHLRRIWVVHKDINTTVFFLPAGEKICKRLQKSFYNILHLF